MGKPTILVVDDDTAVLRAMERDLRRRFGADYRVLAVDSPTAALERLQQLQRRGGEVALLVTDQWTPGMIRSDTRVKRPIGTLQESDGIA